VRSAVLPRGSLTRTLTCWPGGLAMIGVGVTVAITGRKS
jgi:hypothetical protein